MPEAKKDITVKYEQMEKGPAFKTITYEHDKMYPKVVYITLNRPDKNNAISIGPEK